MHLVNISRVFLVFLKCRTLEYLQHLLQVTGQFSSIQFENLPVLLHSVAAHFLHFGCLSTQSKNNAHSSIIYMQYSLDCSMINYDFGKIQASDLTRNH